MGEPKNAGGDDIPAEVVERTASGNIPRRAGGCQGNPAWREVHRAVDGQGTKQMARRNGKCFAGPNFFDASNIRIASIPFD